MDNRVGTKITVLDILGKGSFGSVYRCTDEFGTALAIKCVSTENEGIPCLMEASIMSTLSHPNLLGAVRTHATPTTLHIVSELAVTDLSKWTRKDKGNHLPDPLLLQAWSHSLIQAVACMHRQNIVHADIKAANILMFANGTIKLGDFTLSTRLWPLTSSTTMKYNHTVCTYTHRPLEVWLNREWDYAVDIWALACTLYEIAYGELLFPCQAHMTPKENALLRERGINCLLDWLEHNPGGPQPAVTVSRAAFLKPSPVTTLTDETYHTFHLSSDFSHPDKQGFNRMLLRMLAVDPARRPTIFDLLSDPYFRLPDPAGSRPEASLPIVPYSIISTHVTPLNAKETARLTKYVQKFTNNEAIIRLSLELYSRCIGLLQLTEYLKIMALMWIASKIVLRSPIQPDCPLYQVLAAERTICTYLSFRLHTSSVKDFQTIRPDRPKA